MEIVISLLWELQIGFLVAGESYVIIFCDQRLLDSDLLNASLDCILYHREFIGDAGLFVKESNSNLGYHLYYSVYKCDLTSQLIWAT